VTDFEDFKVQRHEMASLARGVARRLEVELVSFAKDAPAGDADLWMLEGIHAAEAELESQRLMYVERARVAGKSWAEIGEALGGITKQAAQQRYGNLG
jgi:hypothetical protein